MKRCSMCGKDSVDFYRNPAMRDGLFAQCKQCCKRYQSEHSTAHQASVLKYKRKVQWWKTEDSTSLRHRFSQAKRLAKHPWKLSFEQWAQLITCPCYYCGGPLSRYGSGLDRIDNRKWYTLANVVPCCGSKNGKTSKGCNFRKGLLEQAGFSHPRTTELMRELFK